MGDEVFERTIDGHHVIVRIDRLMAWERLAGLENASIVALLVALAVATWVRLTQPSLRALAGLVPFLGLVGGLVAVIGGALRTAAASSSVLGLFPALDERLASVGLAPVLVVAVSIGALVGAICDLPAWRDPRPWKQGARLALLSLPLALALGALHASADVRAYRRELAAIAPLPHLAVDGPVTLHVGQTRVVLPRLTELAVRALPNMLFFIPGRHFVTAEAGTPTDAAHLEAHEWRRVTMEEAAVASWSAETLEIHAPQTPGPFTTTVAFERGPVRVSVDVEALAISDAPDPLFPLATGTERRFARARRVRGGEPLTLPTLTLRVDGEVARDGFRVLTVTLLEGETPTSTEEVVPWAGSYRMDADAEAPLFLERPESTPETGAAETLGELCVIRPLGMDVLCECAVQAPAGPRRCTHVDSHVGESLFALGLGLLTLGASAVAGVTMPNATVTELRLESAEGVPAQTPSLLADWAPRRRSR